MVLTDSSKMPFGEHAGKRMDEVPEEWYQWFWKRTGGVSLHQGVNGRAILAYIKENAAALSIKELIPKS